MAFRNLINPFSVPVYFDEKEKKWIYPDNDYSKPFRDSPYTINLARDEKHPSDNFPIYIDNNFLGINKWLVSKTIKYYEEKDINIKLQLDEQNGYSQYKNCPSLIVAFGFDEFAAGISELFDGQDVLVVSK